MKYINITILFILLLISMKAYNNYQDYKAIPYAERVELARQSDCDKLDIEYQPSCNQRYYSMNESRD